jgi:hypothetical protein
MTEPKLKEIAPMAPLQLLREKVARQAEPLTIAMAIVEMDLAILYAITAPQH